MRICSPQLGISPMSILGGEIYDRELLVEFGNSGNEIEVILPLGKQVPKAKNWKITYILIPFVVPPHLFNILVLPYLLYIHMRRPFDVLRIHSLTFLGLAGIVFKKIFPQVVVVGHCHWLGEGGLGERWMLPRVIDQFDAIICDSYFTQRKLVTLFPECKSKIYAIHNGVDRNLHLVSKSNELRNKYQIDSKTSVFLYMGLFIERKNPLFLLSVVQKLRKTGVDVVVFMCGKGPLVNKIQEESKHLGITNFVKIISPVFGEEKNLLLNTADIFVHPALNEGFSLSVIEAMVVGLPIVMTKGHSAPEAIIEGKNGFLCQNESEWISVLKRLVENRSLRQRMQKENLAKVKREFNWEVIAQKHLSLLRDLKTRGFNN